MTPGSKPALDPALLAAVEELVERRVAEKVEERMAGLESRVAEALQRLDGVEADRLSDRASILVFSGDFDKLMSAFIIATGASAMGFDVSMYFTFWGLTALKTRTVMRGKSVPEMMVAGMMPLGPKTTGTSKLNMAGMGPVFFKHLMKQNHVETLPDLIALAQELGVRLVACQMAMGIMGISRDELIDGIEYGGVATYLGDAMDSRLTLQI